MVTTWNDNLNRILALVHTYFGSAARHRLEDDIYEEFSAIGRALEQFVRDAASPDHDVGASPIGRRLSWLGRQVYDYNVSMLELLQEDRLGRDAPAAGPRQENPAPLLQFGHQGQAVSRLQTALAGAGVFDERIDGSFGRDTEVAVRELQGVAGLEVDGVVGPARGLRSRKSAATAAAVDGRALSLARVATNSARLKRPSAIGRTTTRGSRSGRPRAGTMAAARPPATSASSSCMSFTRCRTSGSKPPTERQRRSNMSAYAVPERAVAQALPRRSASATGPSPAGWSPGRASSIASGSRYVALEPWQTRTRGVLVLLGDRDVEPAADEQRQRLLGLSLDELHPQKRMRLGEPVERRHRQRCRGGLERRHADRAADLAEPGRRARPRPARDGPAALPPA